MNFNSVFHCPHCGHYTKGDAFYQGNWVNCPCGRKAWNVNPRTVDVPEIAEQFGAVNAPPYVLVDPTKLRG